MRGSSRRAGSLALSGQGQASNRPAYDDGATMKIATYNVNGVNARLPVLLRWLDLAEPDIVYLQELKAPQDKFPERAIRDAGYDAV